MSERKRALWKARNRAFRELASRHPLEYGLLRNEELERLGEEPVLMQGEEDDAASAA